MLTLLDKVTKYKKVENRFHTPGQSNNLNDELYSNNKYDITELSFSDNLLYPNGVIRSLEIELEKIYHTKRTLVITTGATCGNFIGINVLKKYGKILVASNAHKSIYSAVNLFNADATFMDNIEEDLPSEITFEKIKSYLDKDKTIKSVVLTSPNYFGKVVNQSVIKKLKDMGLLVMVDEAHGGHFVFSSLLPTSLASIADITVDSVHKTLPVYTGGALLHVANNSLIAETEFYHSILHSSSPNYVTMCSIDYMQALFSREGESLYQKLFDVVNSIKLNNFKVIKTDDFSRLVIDTMPYEASAVQQKLEEENVFIEMSYKHYLVLILSPLNISSLVNSIDIINKISSKLTSETTPLYVKEVAPTNSGDNSALKGEVISIELKEASSYVSAGEVGLYPPGVPLIKSGDIIKEEQVNYLLENKERLFGVVKGKIFVYKKD